MSDKTQDYINALYWIANATKQELAMHGKFVAANALGLPLEEPTNDHISDPEGD